MRVLADTSIWIDFLNGEKYALPLTELLQDGFVLGHLLIEGELRAGNLPRVRKQFLDDYSLLPKLPFVPWPDVFHLIELEGLAGSGLSIIDIHLFASAKAEAKTVWTKDLTLGRLLKKNSLNYAP